MIAHIKSGASPKLHWSWWHTGHTSRHHTYQDKQASNHDQHHHHDDGDDATRQMLHGKSRGFLIHIVHQDVLHLQALGAHLGWKGFLVREQGQHFHLQEEDKESVSKQVCLYTFL